MFCMECGENLPDKAKFCKSCGTKTESDNTINNLNNMDNEIEKKDLIIENTDDEIIEIKKGTIKKSSSIDEIIINENRSFQKNKTHTKLRSVYKDLDDEDVEEMIIKNNFFDSELNQNGSFVNDYLEDTINGDKVIIDRATNLMWHQSGSSNEMELSEAKEWISSLNSRGYAGYNDWKLPTLEEGASLLENSKSSNGFFVDSKFSKKQILIWTGDSIGSGLAWVVFFYIGFVDGYFAGSDGYVRPVRSR